MITSFTFTIGAFYGLAPKLDNPHAWLAWKNQPFTLEKQAELSLAHLPVNLKRRSSTGVKLALETAFECISRNINTASQSIDYTIFASQHGESSKVQALLKQILHKEMLSPIDFSQSVHNTASGLFSLAKSITANVNSIAAGRDTFLMAFIEALTYLRLNPNSNVLLVAYDECLPECYETYVSQYDQQYACAFLLHNRWADCRNLIQCRLKLADAQVNKTSDYPPALNFMAWLYDSVDKSLRLSSAFWRFNWYKNS